MRPRVFIYAATLAAAGIPLYIHLPLFAHRELGLGFETLGLTLLLLRGVDFLQDPFLGRLADRLPHRHAALAALAMTGMGTGFVLLFTAPAFFTLPLPPLLWMILSLILIFTSFSLATILFYAQGVLWAKELGGHLSLGGTREAGFLAGVAVATLLPSLLQFSNVNPYGMFGLVLGALCLLALAAAAPLWQRITPQNTPFFPSSRASRLLVLALVNALPVALTSTLFLIFVQYHLDLPDLAGAFLLSFFAAAGLSAPLWARAAQAYGARKVLLVTMSAAIFSFLWTSQLGNGDMAAFFAISLLSGAAIGADFVILPALFAGALSSQGTGTGTGTGFGLWAFANKMALALAAGALALLGFNVQGPAPDPSALIFAYALLPCLLKLAAITMVWRLNDKKDSL